MKKNYTLFVLIVFLSCNTERPITDTGYQQLRDWMQHSAKMYTNDLTSWLNETLLDSTSMAFPDGGLIIGKENILKDQTGTGMSGRLFNVETKRIHFLSKDIAIIDNQAHFSGGKDGKGNAIPDSYDAGTHIVQRINGQWKLAALRVLPMRTNYQDVKNAIGETMNTYTQACIDGDVDKATQVFTNDAKFYPQGSAVVENAGELKKAFQKSFDEYSNQTLNFNILDMDINGDHAYVLGGFDQVFSSKKSNTKTSLAGNFYTVWRFDSDGKWRITRFMYNIR